MTDNFVFDACALIALFRKESGSDKVQRLLHLASVENCRIYIHKVTIIEVLYDQMRAIQNLDTQRLITVIKALPLFSIDDLSDPFLESVAHHKVAYKVSFADCFVLALAQTKNAAIITSDHHEFDAIEKIGELKFHWIR